jgi:hypothetical protein
MSGVQVRGVDALKAFSVNLLRPYVPPAPRKLESSAREADLEAQVGGWVGGRVQMCRQHVCVVTDLGACSASICLAVAAFRNSMVRALALLVHAA